MAMGNNPMIYIDADGRTWKIFEKIGDVAEGVWDGFWMVANDIRKWGEGLGINSFNAGVSYNSQGQVQPIGDINGYPLFSNEAQYEAAAQNVIDEMNDTRGEYFSKQAQNRAYKQHVNHKVMRIELQQQQYNNSSQIKNAKIPAWVIAAIAATEPVAYSLEVTGSTEVGMAGSMSPWGGIFITRGPDRFKYNNFVSGGLSAGWVSVSLMGVANKYYYLGDINNFRMETVAGWGNNLSGSADIGIAVGGNVS